MPSKHYCDYCDAFLTHDSFKGRKEHNHGFKHREVFRNYYMQFVGMGYGAEGQMTQPGMAPPGMLPGFPPRPMLPGGMLPPGAPVPPVGLLPPRPPVMPMLAPGLLPPTPPNTAAPGAGSATAPAAPRLMFQPSLSSNAAAELPPGEDAAMPPSGGVFSSGSQTGQAAEDGDGQMDAGPAEEAPPGS